MPSRYLLRPRARTTPGLNALRRGAPRWLASLCCLPLLATSSPALAQALTFAQALDRALAADPSVPAAEARAAAAAAAVRQAGVRLNPSISVDVENIAGTGPYSLLDRTETTLSYQQTLERGGKRGARVGVAEAEREVAELRRRVSALDLARNVELAWVEALAAERAITIAEDRLAVARTFRDEVDRRVRAARDPLFAGARADAQVAQAELEVSQARITAENARRALAAYWGGGDDLTLDGTALEDLSAATTAPAAAETADLALLAAQRDVASARVRLEQSRAVADPTVRAGVRHLWEDQALAFVVGGSVPLQRYDRNRAGIERARAERLAAEREIAAAVAVREREIARLQARLAAAAGEIGRIDAEVIPAAQRTITLVREGFARGGGAFTYLDVIEAWRVLLDARARRVEVLRAFHTDRAALNRLTGSYPGLGPSQDPRS